MSKSKSRIVAPRANWGANETPRHCRKCKSTKSLVVDTKQRSNPHRTIRYRVCGACGVRYSTIEAGEQQ